MDVFAVVVVVFVVAALDAPPAVETAEEEYCRCNCGACAAATPRPTAGETDRGGRLPESIGGTVWAWDGVGDKEISPGGVASGICATCTADREGVDGVLEMGDWGSVIHILVGLAHRRYI